MSAAPLMLLDIGSTLVRATASGPAARLAPRLGLSAEQRRTLNQALMTTDFETSEAVCEFVGATFDLKAEAVWDAVREVWDTQEHDAQPVPGAAEALVRLHSEGWQLGLISNIWRPYLNSVRRHFGALFDCRIASELQLLSFQFGWAKPSPQIFLAALSRAGVSAENAVMVGDSYSYDIHPAAELGMSTVWVLSRPEREVESLDRVRTGKAPRPTQTVPSIAALDARLLLCAP